MNNEVEFPEDRCPLDLGFFDSIERNASKIARDIDTHLIFEIFKEHTDDTDPKLVQATIDFYNNYKLEE